MSVRDLGGSFKFAGKWVHFCWQRRSIYNTKEESMRGTFWRLIAAAMVPLTLAMCSTPQTTTSPTAQPTPVVNPPTPISPEQAQVIREALTRTRAATAYRLEREWIGRGELENVMFHIGLENPEDEGLMGGINLSCKANDCAIHMRGGIAGIFGVDPKRGIEAMSIQGTGYIRGPIPEGILKGLTEDSWYRTPGIASLFAVSILPDPLLFGFLDKDEPSRLTSFAHTGREALDGMQCDVYTMTDPDITLAVYNSASSDQVNLSSDSTDPGELKLWICDDGYFHQMTARIAGRTMKDPPKQIERRLRLHIYDYGKIPDITPPTNVIDTTLK